MSTRHAQKKNLFDGAVRGVTLVEMLVTLAIFALVTLVVTSTFLTLFGTRNQTRAAQQLLDDTRILFDTMEVEITAGSKFDNSACTSGACTQFSFTTKSRDDLPAYTVTYRLHNNRLEKARETETAPCDSTHIASDGSFPEACYLPITAPNVKVTTLNFAATIPPGSASNRPLITVLLGGEATTDTGEVIPLEYSTTFSPGKAQLDVSALESESMADTDSPDVTFKDIRPGGSCTITNAPATDSLPANQPVGSLLNPILTDCTHVLVTFKAEDAGTGLHYVGVYGNVAVDAPANKTCDDLTACWPGDGDDPEDVGAAPSVTVTDADLYLRPGADQILTLYASDYADPENVRSNVAIYIKNTQAAPALTVAGMQGYGFKYCELENGYSFLGFYLKIIPSTVYQQTLRLYRCSADAATTSCTPLDNIEADPDDLYNNKPDGYFTYEPGLGGYTCLYGACYSEGFALWNGDELDEGDINAIPDEAWFVPLDKYYRYGFRVYDPSTGNESADMGWVVWDHTTSDCYAYGDCTSALASGALDNTVAYLPADYCIPDPYDPGAGGGGGGGGSTPTDITGDGIPDEDINGDGNIDSGDLFPITMSRSANAWEAVVDHSDGGLQRTSTAIKFTNTTSNLYVGMEIVSVTQGAASFSGVVLNPWEEPVFDPGEAANIFLEIPGSMADGIYTVNVEFYGANATAVLPMTLSLLVSPSYINPT